MKQLNFPTDFNEMPHSVMPGAKQWEPKEETETFISIVGGAYGLYGDGLTTFEIMIADEVTGWQTQEEINELLAAIATPVNEGQQQPEGLPHITVGKLIEWLNRRPDTMDKSLKISFENKILAVCSLNDGGDAMYLNVEIE